MNPIKQPLMLAWNILPLLALSACGGGDSSPATPAASAKLGGYLAGAFDHGSLTLVNSNGDTLALTSDGTFSFAGGLSAGANYSVSIQTLPQDTSCYLNNGSGQVDANADNVGTIWVVCSPIPPVATHNQALTLTVSGLGKSNPVVVHIQGMPLTISTNGSYTFDVPNLAISALYASVATNPQHQTCTASDAASDSGFLTNIRCQ